MYLFVSILCHFFRQTVPIPARQCLTLPNRRFPQQPEHQGFERLFSTKPTGAAGIKALTLDQLV
jgi:hypothetical protein